MRYTVGGLVMLGLGLAFYRKKIFAVSRNDILKLVLLGSVGWYCIPFLSSAGKSIPALLILL